MLPSADELYGDADFPSQHDLAPAHNAKTSAQFADHYISVLHFASQRTQPEPLPPVENLWGICQEEDEKHLTLKHR